MKPMLAEDYIPSKLQFPCGMQPKIDGVRGLNMLGKLTGRSLKAHKNKFTTAFYSHSCLIGFDGELAAAHECDPALCRKTSSAVGTIEGQPFTLWWLFDYITPQTRLLGYTERYERLVERVRELYHTNNDIWQHLRVMPFVVVNSLEELKAQHSKWMNEGYEGSCIRKLDGMHKQGRSTVREMGLLRIKDFIESEARIVGFEEGETNTNPAQINELGKTFRSSHKEGKIPNGMIGNLKGRQIGDVFDPYNKDVKLISDGDIITISTGTLTDAECKQFFENPGLLLGRISKYKFFPKGIKDKPRFAQHQSFRIASDIS